MVKLELLWGLKCVALFCLSALVGCKSAPIKEVVISSVIKQTNPPEALDTSASLHHWKQLPKQLINIDPWKADQFVYTHLFSSSFLLEDTLSLELIDLNGDQEEELWVTFGEEHTALYQQDTANYWQEIWNGYEDGGYPPELCKAPFYGIKYYTYMSCSNCSQDGVTYAVLDGKTVKPIVHLFWGYNYDYERTSGTGELYEQCDANFEWKGKELEVVLDIQFSLLETNIVFVEDTVTLIYEWSKERDRLLLKQITPAALKPIFLKWKALEDQKEKGVNEGHNSNKIAFLAYWEYHAASIIALQEQAIYQGSIQEIEQEYQTTWSELIATWTTDHSFAMIEK